MAATQARTERQISELLKRPGNDVCADCSSPSPRWCSWNLGIFLCVACASVHRKMGSHVSRVKSLTLDTFTREQIDSLSKVGNTKGNAERRNDDRINPPPTNLEMEGRDNELERYIRKKYMSPRPLPAASNLLAARQPPTLQATRDNIPLRRSPTPGSVASAPGLAPRSAPSPASQQQSRPSSTTPVFSSVLEHRPASEGMRRGRPTPSATAGPVGSFQPQQAALAGVGGGYNPSMGFATSIQAAQQQQQQQQFAPPSQPQVPAHGAWGDLLSLSQPPSQMQQPFLSPQPSSFTPSPYFNNGFSSGTPSIQGFGQPTSSFGQQPRQHFSAQPSTAYPPAPYGQLSSFTPPPMFLGQQQPMQQGAFASQQMAHAPQPHQFQPTASQQQSQPQASQQQPSNGAQSFMHGMMPPRQVGLPSTGGGGR